MSLTNHCHVKLNGGTVYSEKDWCIVLHNFMCVLFNQSNFYSATIPGVARLGRVIANQCSTANLMKQFCIINGPSGVLIFIVERPSQR